mmetsp:Transcript_19637/g.75383  ORF Transcript_19637/g.75383 Transcript_19637/m.75383 type:complete len:218 (+) Transcript_19637:672-1325(+)
MLPAPWLASARFDVARFPAAAFSGTARAVSASRSKVPSSSPRSNASMSSTAHSSAKGSAEVSTSPVPGSRRSHTSLERLYRHRPLPCRGTGPETRLGRRCSDALPGTVCSSLPGCRGWPLSAWSSSSGTTVSTARSAGLDGPARPLCRPACGLRGLTCPGCPMKLPVAALVGATSSATGRPRLLSAASPPGGRSASEAHCKKVQGRYPRRGWLGSGP